MNWRMVIGGGLLLAALASGWSAWRHRETKAPSGASQVRADYVLGEFEIVTLGKDGKEAATLRAPSMERNAADQTSTIARPVFLLPDAEGRHWQLQADTGWVSAKGEELRLRGNVAGDSPQDGSTPPTTFRTTALDVFPERNLARTAERVTLTRPGLEQTGVGFEAQLKSRQYSLLSQVKTRYEPTAARQAR
ncbi:LPS export ABC transporter periplasmic protein LptC [Stenotrophomonas sp. MYb238]|uniref:LPS export ABC transporter periplasmic protein LptC n=1 Tax=Stenotrophomonas sp. MYb238 TaxID=2040281 RepID=UPI00129250BC|nr:LPS export ABC transporter periplasmic protein LptC [Stenotrophomonas sp. MYb238]MQP76965.1 LPS export ABC transporter periplasmic protein LptC [Stenotrophomonas sp. MYb238]